MPTSKQAAVQSAIGKKWAAILGGVGVVVSAVVPPIVSVLRGGSTVTASGNGVAVGGNLSVSTNVQNSFGDVWIDGAKTILGMNRSASNRNAQSIPAAQQANIAAPPASAASMVQAPSASSLPKYEDKHLRATGMTSSLGNNGENTVIPVKIENRTEADLLIGHDSEVVTAITDTGETNGNTGGCNMSGVRGFHLENLQKPYDPLLFSAIAPGGSITLQITCFFKVSDPVKVNRINVNVPLVRLDGESVKRFTLNISDIPTSK